MTFIHEDPEFSKLLAMVGAARNLDEPLVEKDYWITHTLQIRRIPEVRDPGFNPDESARWRGIRLAHKSIQPMFWGPRLSLEEATASIRSFLGGLESGLMAGLKPSI